MKVSELLDYVKDRAGFEEVLRALDVPAFAIKSPIAIEKIGRRQGLALDELDFQATYHAANQDPSSRPLSADALELV